MRALAALLLVALLAGCSGSWFRSDPPPPSTTVAADVMVHRAVGQSVEAAALPASFQGVRYATVSTGFAGAEPSIGISSKGTAFVAAYEWVARSTDGGKSWQGAHKAPGGQDFDPMLWVDKQTGRILVTHINPQKTCRTVAVSDDDGATWSDNPMVCPPASAGQVDHQKLSSGRNVGAQGSQGVTYPRLVTLCYNNRGSTRCAASHDGGLTFLQDMGVDGLPVGSTIPVLPQAGDLVGDCGGLNGQQHHAEDGTIYVPYGYECKQSRIAVSTDGGLTWARRNPRQGELELDPAVATTTDGTAYYLYRGEDQRMHLLRSRDGFASADGPYLVSPPEVRSTVFAALVAGSDGRIAFAYLGTNGTAAGPDKASGLVSWSLYAGMSLDADTQAPTVVTVRITPPDDPVQRGSICVTLPCAKDDRNLLDFIGMAMGPDGRPWIAFTDGCTSVACRTPGQLDPQTSRGDTASVAWLRSGPSLLASHGRLS